jgi:hypothetical protein
MSLMRPTCSCFLQFVLPIIYISNETNVFLFSTIRASRCLSNETNVFLFSTIRASHCLSNETNVKDKRINTDLRNITQKTKYWATQTYYKLGVNSGPFLVLLLKMTRTSFDMKIVDFHFYLCKTGCICFYVFPIRQKKYLLVICYSWIHPQFIVGLCCSIFSFLCNVS